MRFGSMFLGKNSEAGLGGLGSEVGSPTPTPQELGGSHLGPRAHPAGEERLVPRSCVGTCPPTCGPRAGAVSQNSLPSSPSARVLLLLAQRGRAEGERVDVNRCGGSWA